jgi:MFS family permease
MKATMQMNGAVELDRSPAWVVLLLVGVSVTLIPMALTGPAVALPGIARDLHANVGALQWVVNGYNLTFAAFMLATGALADRVGRRRVYRLGTGLFGLGALVCTLASSILVIQIARTAAGIGAAAAITSGSALLAARFEGAARARAFGLFGTALGAGLAFGPLVSGSLLAGVGWRGVFAIPAAFGLLVAVAARALGESRNPVARPVDMAGTVTFTGGLFLLILAIVEAPAQGWGSGLVIGCFAGCVVLLAGFVLVEHLQRAPMFDLELLRYPRFVGVCAAAAALAFTLLPVVVFLPTYFSAVEGFTAVHAGAILLLFTGPTLIVPVLAGPLTALVPLRALLVVAMFIVAGGDAWLTIVLAPHSGLGFLAGPLLVTGTGFGLTLAVLDGAAVSSVELDRAGMASGMFNALRLTADTAAVAVAGSLLITITSGILTGRVPDPGAVADAVNTGVFTDSAVATGAFTTAFHVVLWIAAGLALIMVPILMATRRHREHEVPDGTEMTCRNSLLSTRKNGGRAFSRCSAAFVYSGVSATFIRMNKPSGMSSADARNGIRHAQSCRLFASTDRRCYDTLHL